VEAARFAAEAARRAEVAAAAKAEADAKLAALQQARAAKPKSKAAKAKRADAASAAAPAHSASAARRADAPSEPPSPSGEGTGARGHGLGLLLPAAYGLYVLLFNYLSNLPVSSEFYLQVQQRFWPQANLLCTVWYAACWQRRTAACSATTRDTP
jgi:hypothetical protein